MKTIFFSVPLGYYAKTLLRTGILERILRDPEVRVVILTPAYRDESFRKEFAYKGRVFFEDLHEVPDRLSLTDRFFWKICNLTWRSRPLFLTSMKLTEKWLNWKSPIRYEKTFKLYRPNLVVTASPGYNSNRDIPLIREAQRAEIPTLCVVYSWDNLTGMKGIMPTRPDYLAVWNEMMQEEAIQRHYYSPERIMIVGPPHFDLYQNDEIFLERENFLKGLKLSPDKKLITIATGTISVDNSFIADLLLCAEKDKRLHDSVQFVLRPHPLEPPHKLEKYLSYGSKHGVKIDTMARKSQTLKWDPTREEMIHVANLMYHSDVVVNVASTMTLEACMADTPIVNVAFDPLNPEGFQEVVMKGHWKHHYRYIRDMGCSTIVYNETELIQAVNAYLSDRNLKAEARKHTAERFCYQLDGKAANRIGKLIQDLIVK